MTSLVADMMAALISAGYATATGTDIFAWQIRPTPAAQLMVMLTGGRPPIPSVDSQTAQPGVQIYVVDADLAAAEAKTEAIRTYFSTLKGSIRQAIWAARSTPVYLGQLEDGRHKFVVEFQVFG
jgi:hypothetical protein